MLKSKKDFVISKRWFTFAIQNKQDVEQLIYGKMKKTRALTQSEYNKINNLYNKYRDGLLKIANDENIDMFIRADISRNLEKLSLPNQIYWNGKC